MWIIVQDPNFGLRLKKIAVTVGGTSTVVWSVSKNLNNLSKPHNFENVSKKLVQ